MVISLGIRKRAITCLHVCGFRGCDGLHLRRMLPVSLPVRFAVSAFPGLLEGAGDAFAWGAAGREVRVEGVALVVVGVGRADVAAQPVALDIAEPDVHAEQRLAADVIDTGAAVVRIGVALNESSGAHEREVVADEWLAGGECAGARGGGAGFVGERPHDPLAQMVGEHAERRKLGRGRPAVVVELLRVASVMHLLIEVLPGSRVSMRNAAPDRLDVRGWVVLLGCLVLTLCGWRGHQEPVRENWLRAVPRGARSGLLPSARRDSKPRAGCPLGVRRLMFLP